jgi:dienelactone hydrolase
MMNREISYNYGELRLKGFFAIDERQSAPRPGVLVIHDAGGLSENIKEKARRLSCLGYGAFALDLFGEGRTVADGMRRIQELGSDLVRWRGLAHAGLTTLAEQPQIDASRLAVIGYCFGGTTAFELARGGVDVKAVVGFHSALSPSSGEADNIKGKVLALLGADDPLIPPEARLAFENEMRDARVDWQMILYGNTGHSFTNPAAAGWSRPGFTYEPKADARSWAEMQRLFVEVLG